MTGPPLEEEPGLGDLTLSGWFRHVTRQGGDSEALVYYEGGLETGDRTSWTYADMWDRANEIARALVACGIGKGERVGILMTNRPEFISATFGAALAGAVATTFSTFSTAAEMEHLLAASGVSILLLERKVLKKDFAEMMAGFDAAIADGKPTSFQSEKFPFLRHIACIGEPLGAIETLDQFIVRGGDTPQNIVDARAASVTPADPGVLFFSSGSTAMPKGVLSAHRGVTLQLWRWPRWYQVEPGEARTWSANGFFWSGNFSMAFGGALTSGGSLVLQSTFDAAEALALIEREKATQVLAWPHQYGQLVAAPNWDVVDLSSLKYVDCKCAMADHPTIDSSWREPYAAFGNTETFTLISAFPANTPEDVISGSVGKACHGNRIKIVDPVSGETVPVGEKGEIVVKGPTLMLGYIGVPNDMVLDGEGYLHTGDGGHIDEEGRLYWHGRLSDIIKTGGANVSPVEVDTLLKTMTGVKAVQTVGVGDDMLGELVVSCIVAQDGADIDEQSVKAFAKEKLASFKVPRRVLFFAEQELSLTGSAKIKTADLRELATKKLAGDSV
ncbi:AMP-binding protein [Altererythrobacter aquaemixtae]|uniref:AMP-binding protein n=1 Tax=Pontixanthobacter aquaemixtae TaxID=1958940 RepID=A0A844ZR00_9SPHN|nr:AMP-binding protein [Pontixanthobacter aquaemixtae]